MLNVTLRDLIAELTSRKPLQAVGTTLNVNYSDIEVGEPLDRGAFGEVYRGKWKGNVVAVKVKTSHILYYTYTAMCAHTVCSLPHQQLQWKNAILPTQ